MPAYSGRSLQYTSTWVLAHYAQFVITDRFEKFSFGELENIIIYGSAKPPQYNVSHITSRSIALFRGLNDAFADNIDVQHLVDQLTGKTIFFNIIKNAVN